MLQVGYSIGKDKVFNSLEKKKINAFQVFVTLPEKSNLETVFNDEEIAKLAELRKQNGIYGVVHGKYIYNFCRQICNHHINQLIHELQVANKLGCDVIIHQGKNVTDEKLSRLEAINNYVKHVSYVLDETSELSNGLIFENSARQGTEIGYNLEELFYIYDQFADHHKERLGFCLDLCHIFVAGELDMRDGNAVRDYIKRFDALIGLTKLKCFHFNDSGIPYAGYHDSHGDIACGYIGNPKLGGSCEGFKVIAQIAKLHKIPIILETHCTLEADHKGSQIVWQMNMIKGWSNNDEQGYKDYILTNSKIQDLSYELYEKNNTKKKPTSTDTQIKVQPTQCSCSVTDQSSVSSDVPKIKIKLKGEQ